MCEAYGTLTIYYQDYRGFTKGRIGSKSFYIPAKGGARMRALAKLNLGQRVSAQLIRGMLVRIYLT